MTRDERRKAIATAAAMAVHNPLIPGPVKVALAAAQEEFDDIDARITELMKLAHAPFDFSELVRRLERLEKEKGLTWPPM